MRGLRNIFRDSFYRWINGVNSIRGLNHYGRVIEPEIQINHKHKMGEMIEKVSSQSHVNKIIEIGSSSGEGSTRYILNGLLKRDLSDFCHLLCIEISAPRFAKLNSILSSHIGYATAVRLSTVKPNELPSYFDVWLFMHKQKTFLSRYSFWSVAVWLFKDRHFLKKNQSLWIPKTALEFAENFFLTRTCDLVIIDGGEFTGQLETKHFWGSKYIFLDDINTFKNYASYLLLKKSNMYKLEMEEWTVSTGWAMFSLIELKDTWEAGKDS